MLVLAVAVEVPVGALDPQAVVVPNGVVSSSTSISTLIPTVDAEVVMETVTVVPAAHVGTAALHSSRSWPFTVSMYRPIKPNVSPVAVTEETVMDVLRIAIPTRTKSPAFPSVTPDTDEMSDPALPTGKELAVDRLMMGSNAPGEAIETLASPAGTPPLVPVTEAFSALMEKEAVTAIGIVAYAVTLTFARPALAFVWAAWTVALFAEQATFPFPRVATTGGERAAVRKADRSPLPEVAASASRDTRNRFSIPRRMPAWLIAVAYWPDEFSP